MIDMWIARDKDGTLCIYKGKPSRYEDFFDNSTNFSTIYLESNLFPEITWENSPKEIELKIK